MKGDTIMDSANGNGMIMPVAPMNYGFGNFGGWGNSFGGDGWWVILFLFALMGNGFGGWGGFGGGMNGLGLDSYLFNTQTQNDVNRGFDNAGLAGQLTGIQSSISNGFANAEVADCNRAMNAMQTAYTNQIADMNERFSLATAVDDRIDNLAMSLQKCCCDSQLQTESLRATVLQENCQDRYEAQNNAANIIANQTANTQRILDKLCDQELAAERRENDQLRQQLNMANLAASQTAQTSRLLADNAAQTQQIENYVRPQINPAYIVPNPYAYNFYPNNGWGNCCGCSNNF